MPRATIDFGIDLGTTNSSIAQLKGTAAEVFKNSDNSEITPSAIWIDQNGALHVGQTAKQRLEYDQENAFSEFKLQMGTTQEYCFANGRQMKPEELSAHVLMSLKEDVFQRMGEDINAAVITVPAAFEFPQCEATNRAAQIAGLETSPLLQEPIAAAIAYGFQSLSDKVFWLVYDFGGGTFDAAIVQLRDGAIQVVNHGGDNHLGGKLLDWEIVEQLFVPALVKEYRLGDFRRSNPKWKTAFGKLKLEAEEAKIRLSHREQERITIERLCVDDRGKAVDFEFDLTRSQLVPLFEPFLVRSVNICRKVLAEKDLHSGDMEKLILVGGPTLTPYLRDRLTDPKDGLGIPLEFSIDPLTVVVRGAAMFAGTQRVEGPARSAVSHRHVIKLDYKPIGSDTEPTVGGQVFASNGERLTGYAVEFVNQDSRPAWRSGKLPLGPDGTFLTNLWAGKEPPTNVFAIRLYDAVGKPHAVEPEEFTYTLGMVPTDPPLSQSLGVALATNEVRLVLAKGTPLPARKTIRDLKTTVHLHRGQDGDLLRVPVVEGGQLQRADRNRLIGSLCVAARDLRRDIPSGSPIEVTIEVDKSRLVRASAYIPALDEEFESVLSLVIEPPVRGQLQQAAEDAKERLRRARDRVATSGDATALDVLKRIERESMVHDVETSLAASENDRDAADKCEKRLLDLNLAIDQLELALKWPGMLAEAEERISEAKVIILEYGAPNDKQLGATLEREIREAITNSDPDQLQLKVSELSTLYYRVLRDQPGSWVAIFNDLLSMRLQMRDPENAEAWIIHGRNAVENGDVAGLRATVHQLISLLPPRERHAFDQGFGSTLGLA